MKESLKAHYKLHPGEKPFECNQCDETFSRYVSLKKHLKTHLEKYICDICGQQFCSQSSLIDHLIIHSGEKAFSCEICGKKLSHKKSLNFHFSLILTRNHIRVKTDSQGQAQVKIEKYAIRKHLP
ncbi:hypothetical protein L9F63_023860, partial [Diploptera punctata]